MRLGRLGQMCHCRLQSLFLQYNKIESLPDVLALFTSLKTLQIEGNLLHNIDVVRYIINIAHPCVGRVVDELDDAGGQRQQARPLTDESGRFASS